MLARARDCLSGAADHQLEFVIGHVIQVRPWVQDVSKDIRLANGSLGDLTYIGTFNGTDPVESSTPGYIMMASSLVFLRFLDLDRVLASNQ